MILARTRESAVLRASKMTPGVMPAMIVSQESDIDRIVAIINQAQTEMEAQWL